MDDSSYEDDVYDVDEDDICHHGVPFDEDCECCDEEDEDEFEED